MPPKRKASYNYMSSNPKRSAPTFRAGNNVFPSTSSADLTFQTVGYVDTPPDSTENDAPIFEYVVNIIHSSCETGRTVNSLVGVFITVEEATQAVVEAHTNIGKRYPCGTHHTEFEVERFGRKCKWGEDSDDEDVEPSVEIVERSVDRSVLPAPDVLSTPIPTMTERLFEYEVKLHRETYTSKRVENSILGVFKTAKIANRVAVEYMEGLNPVSGFNTEKGFLGMVVVRAVFKHAGEIEEVNLEVVRRLKACPQYFWVVEENGVTVSMHANLKGAKEALRSRVMQIVLKERKEWCHYAIGEGRLEGLFFRQGKRGKKIRRTFIRVVRHEIV